MKNVPYRTMRFIWLFPALCLWVVGCCANQGQEVSSDNLFYHLISKRQVRICGHELADALSLVCDGVFRKRNLQRRNHDGSYNDFPSNFYFLLRNMDDNPDFDAPAHSKSTAGLVRVARQVSDECCKERCSYWKLKAYCGTQE